MTEMEKQGPTVRKIVAEWVKETDYFGTTIYADEIVEDFLDAHADEYDGLCGDDGTEEGCGCDRDDPMPCNENVADCRARRKCDAVEVTR